MGNEFVALQKNIGVQMKDLKELVRKNILDLKPYSSARDEYKGVKASVFLDANESPYNNPVNRYPDPLQEDLKAMLANVKGVEKNKIFLGNGSDEAIDLVYRIFCRPEKDNVVALEPTYGMYEVCADINDVEYRKVRLDDDFQFKAEWLLDAVDENTKLIFICSPNNPTGNNLSREEIVKVLELFDGIVVIDEAYSDFSCARPFRLDLDKYKNMIVLNTFSKAMGCAAIRLGIAYAQPEIIEFFNKVKYPYNVNQLTQEKAKEVLTNLPSIQMQVNMILEERRFLVEAFSVLPLCRKVYPTDSNFFLAKVDDADKIYRYLVDNGIIVRNRSKVALCGDCLRVTVGNKSENTQLLAALRKYKG